MNGNGHFRGRVALYAILQELGVRPGEPVVVPAFTCSAVAEAILAAGAIPWWIDVEPNGVTLSSAGLRTALQASGARIALVQATFGIPPEPDTWQVLADHASVVVIEDLCHTAPGTRFSPHDQPNPWFGFYSFEWSKPLAGGLGGLAVRADGTEVSGGADPGLKHELQLAAASMPRFVAKQPRAYWPVRQALGAARGTSEPSGADQTVWPSPHSLPDDYGLAMARSARARVRVAQRRLPVSIARALAMTETLRQIAGEPISTERVTATTVLSRFPILVDDRAALLAQAEAAKVEMMTWFSTPVEPLLGDGLRSVNYEPGSCPNAEAASDRVVSLPLWTRQGDRYLERLRAVFASGAAR